MMIKYFIKAASSVASLSYGNVSDNNLLKQA